MFIFQIHKQISIIILLLSFIFIIPINNNLNDKKKKTLNIENKNSYINRNNYKNNQNIRKLRIQNDINIIPPIPQWHKSLHNFFNISINNKLNSFEDPSNCTENYGLEYYIFVIVTKIDGITENADFLQYAGLCLKKAENIEDIQDDKLVEMTELYLWKEAHMMESSLIDIIPLYQNTYTYPSRAILVILVIISYILFTIYVSFYPKKEESDYIKDQELVEIAESEIEQEINYIHNLNNIRDDYNENKYVLNNDNNVLKENLLEDRGGYYEKNIKSNLSSSRTFRKRKVKDTQNKIEDEKPKYDKMMVKHIKLGYNYNNKKVDVFRDKIISLWFNKNFFNGLFNSFSLSRNLKYIFNTNKFTKYLKYNSNNIEIINTENKKVIKKELKIVYGVLFWSYFLSTYYSALSILEKIPLDNPIILIREAGNIMGQIIYNGYFFYTNIFCIQGFIQGYKYCKNLNNISFSYVAIDILREFLTNYILVVVLFFIFSECFIFLSSKPLSNYFYEQEYFNCNCQTVPILTMVANITYGLYEKYYPFCVYHFWHIFSLFQYHIIGSFLLIIYAKLKSLFYLLIFLLWFVCEMLQIISLDIYSLPMSPYDMINRNIKPFFGQYGFKTFTRATPFIYGLYFGIVFCEINNCSNNLKSASYIKKIQKSKLNNYLVYMFCFLLEILIYSMQYLNINRIYMFKDNIITFIYKIFKHDLFSIGLLGTLIGLFSDIGLFKRINKFFFTNKYVEILKHISVTLFLMFPILIRGIFYTYGETIHLPENRIVFYFYILLFSILNIIISILINAIFVAPFERAIITIKTALKQINSDNK